MGDKTNISWTDSSWNPVRGCARVSEGCRNCYAETIAARFSDRGAPYHGFAERGRVGSKWTGRVNIVESVLDQPMRWRKPRRIFVNSMSDIFHEKLSDEDIDRVFAVMALAPQHKFQVLTKRADRMQSYMNERWQPARAQKIGDLNIPTETIGEGRHSQVERACKPFLDRFDLANTNKDHLWTKDGSCKAMQWKWPLPNVWLGVSVENQAEADRRIPHLLDTPAAVRFLSCEPLLEPLDLSVHLSDLPSIHWVIVGGESGPNARPMHPHWAMGLRDQCAAAGAAFFMKQVGSRHEWWPSGVTGNGDDPMQWPEALRVQEFPERTNA